MGRGIATANKKNHPVLLTTFRINDKFKVVDFPPPFGPCHKHYPFNGEGEVLTYQHPNFLVRLQSGFFPK
jgi:hypothetical protein